MGIRSHQMRLASINSIHQFWSWLKEHEKSLFDGINREANRDYAVSDMSLNEYFNNVSGIKKPEIDQELIDIQILDEMEETFYNLDDPRAKTLKLSIGEMGSKGRRQLILTGLGSPVGMQNASELVRTRPLFKYFEIMSMKPRKQTSSYLLHEQCIVNQDDIRYQLIPGKYRFDINVAIKNMSKVNDDCIHREIIELIIDCIGEYEFSRDIGKVRLEPTKEATFNEMNSLSRLQAEYDLLVNNSFIIN